MKKFVNIRTVSGSINLRKESAKAHFFHAPKRGGKGVKEAFLDTAATAKDTGGQDGAVARAGFAQFTNSVHGVDKKIGGGMVTQSFIVAEGEILKCFISVRPSYGKLPKSASLFLRVRSGAAYRKLRFKLLSHHDAVFTHAEIEGTFDLLTTEEALSYGVHIPMAYRSFSDSGNVDSVLTENIVVLAEKEAPIKLVEKELVDESGNSKTILQRKRRRVIG